MIVFISDLHFVDETAGKNNINSKAFEGAFKDIKKYMVKFFFSWEEIPGNESERLTDFLKSNYELDWVKTAKIEKTNNGKTIMITAGKNSISLNLNNENTELNIKFDDGKTDKFIVNTENGKLNIFNIDEIKLVFLGDIFDLNRTTDWLNIDKSERPWGDLMNKGSAIENHSNVIFDNIIKKNEETFKIFKGSMKKYFGFPVEPERIFIPGNHDRLCNVYETLREKVRINLGMPVCKDPFPHMYDNKNYGVIAMHGHEFDKWNYEGTTKYTDSDYAKIPMGDLITTEIASRLPYTIMKHVKDIPMDIMDTAERESLKRNLNEIDNVRPYTALFDWLFYQVREKPEKKKEINEAVRETAKKAVREIAKNLDKLPYFHEWCNKNDELLKIDDVDKLQTFVDLFKGKLFDVYSLEWLVKNSKIFSSPDNLPMDNCDSVLIRKAKDCLMKKPEYRYCIMGHTHIPRQVPISRNNKQFEQFYLNTGTWRKSYHKVEQNFIGLKNLTYTIIYSEKENPCQRFETWTGTLKEE